MTFKAEAVGANQIKNVFRMHTKRSAMKGKLIILTFLIILED